MKYSIIILMLLFSTLTFGQTLIATTEDGRRVVLNDDKTWSFIDTNPKPVSANTDKYPSCNLSSDFEEPKGDRKIQGWLKRVDAQVKDLKEHVAVDNNCSVEDIKLTSLSEQKGNGNYVLCVKGKEMRYRRTGSVFHRQGVSPVGKY